MTGKGQRQGKDIEKNRDRTKSVKGEVRTGTRKVKGEIRTGLDKKCERRSKYRDWTRKNTWKRQWTLNH